MSNAIATIASVVTSEELDSIGEGTSSAMSVTMARATKAMARVSATIAARVVLDAIARVVVTAMARVVLIVAVRVVS